MSNLHLILPNVFFIFDIVVFIFISSVWFSFISPMSLLKIFKLTLNYLNIHNAVIIVSVPLPLNSITSHLWFFFFNVFRIINQSSCMLDNFFKAYFYFYFEREKEREREWGRGREQGREGESQAGSTWSVHRAQCEIMTWAEINSWILNWLRHPGAPACLIIFDWMTDIVHFTLVAKEVFVCFIWLFLFL